MTPSRQNFALAVASIVIVVALLEGALAFGLRHPHLARGPLVGVLRQVHRMAEWRFPQLDPACARWDPELGYTLAPPGCTVRDREFTVRYDVNSAGLRDDEASLARPELIVLGDSYAMGWGVAHARSFPELVGRRLGLRTLAAGVSSYGTAREMLLLGRLDRSSVRALVLQYCWNDADENRAWRAGGGRLPITSREAYDALVAEHQRGLRYWPGKYVTALVSAVARRLRPATAHAHAVDVPPGDVRQAVDDLLVLLEHHRDAVGPHPVVVVPLCEREREVAAELRARAAAAAAGTVAGRVSVVEVASRLEARHLFPLDGHLNAAGHGLLAGRLAAELARRGVGDDRRAEGAAGGSRR